MTESTTTKDASSLPLLLTLSGAVLVVAVGGWFLLEPDVPDAPAYQDSAIDMAKLPENAATPERVVADSEQVTIEATDIETQLRKARLASAAEILIFPRDQSALHYYGSVLAADPQHAVANAELDTMLAGVAQTVEDHLAEGEYAEAYAIASLVAEARPEHSLVTGTRQALDSYKEQRILEAIEQARDGKDDEASATLALAQALPGRRADEFATVKSTIADIKAAREAAEQDRRQRAQLAANDARAAWVNRIETAIQQGNLIAPAGSSAKDLLAERNSWRSERERLAGELITALKLGTELEIAAGRLPAAEKLLAAAIELGGESDDFADLQELLESALVEAESNRVRRLDELVALKTVAPKYPKRAEMRGLSGWVLVEFTVNTSGETTDIRIKEAEPKDVFDEAVVEAVQQWRFEPGEFHGRPISQKGSTRLGFRLAE